MRLRTGRASNLDSIFRDTIVDHNERAAVGGATGHGGSASETVVNRSPVVDIQPVHLFSSHGSVIVRGLNLSMVAVLGQDIFDRVHCPGVRQRKTLILCNPNDAE
jgi:hypothetical protein